jgi:hypothetical protein
MLLNEETPSSTDIQKTFFFKKKIAMNYGAPVQRKVFRINSCAAE